MWDIVANGQQAAQSINPSLFRSAANTPGYNSHGWADYGSQVEAGRTSGQQGAEQQYSTVGSNFDWSGADTANYLKSLGYNGEVWGPTGDVQQSSFGSGGGDSGGDVASNLPTYGVSPQLTKWMADNGLTMRVNTGEAGSQAALFNAQGQQAGDGVKYSDDDDPGGWFGLAALAAGGLVGGAVAGAGAAAGGAGSAAADSAAATGAAASADGGALSGAGLYGGGGTSIGSGLGIDGFGAGLGSATTATGVTGGLTEAGALGAVGSAGVGSVGGGMTGALADAAGGGGTSGGSEIANTGSDAHFYQSTPNGTGVQDLANMGGAGTPTIPTLDMSTPGAMQSAIKAATSTAGQKLIGAGLTAALAGGAAGAAAGGTGSASGGTGSQTGVAGVQTKNAADQIAFNQAQFAAGQPTRDAATAGALQAQAGQLATQTQQNDIAKTYAAEDAGTFAPLRQQIVADAKGYDTAGRRADAVAGATSDVEQAYGSANDANNRALLRAGVTPGSGRMQSLMADQAIAKANSIAGATTTAVRNVENTGAQRMAAAAQLGSFLPSAETSAASSGSAAGTAASGSGATAVGTQAAGISNVNTGYAGASSTNNSAGSLYGQAASETNKVSAQDNANIGAIGSALGTYLGTTQGQQNVGDLANWLSDKKMKKDTGKKANGMQALAEINKTPVKTGWSYDPAKGGPDERGTKHTGPMAQDVHKTMGESVAPGGKQISPMDMSGKMMAAMQALSAKVAKLEKNRRAA